MPGPIVVGTRRQGGHLMKALVYHGPGQKAWEEGPDPEIIDPTDAIVQVDTTTICGTDLHILKGDVPAVTDGRILGHEGVGTITEIGDHRPDRCDRAGGYHHDLRDRPAHPQGGRPGGDRRADPRARRCRDDHRDRRSSTRPMRSCRWIPPRSAGPTCTSSRGTSRR